jgi:hypothetical protein
VILGHGHAGQLPAASGAVPAGQRSCQPGTEQRRPQRAGRQRCRQLGQGLLHLPGRQVLDLDHAELADRMTGNTPVIPDGAGPPRRGSAAEPVPDAGRHRAGQQRRQARPGVHGGMPGASPGLRPLVRPRTFCRIRRLAGEIAWWCCHALISVSTMSERSAAHSERRSSSSGSVDGDAARRRRSRRTADILRRYARIRLLSVMIFPSGQCSAG